MDLDALIEHFFETDDPATLTEGEFALAIERIKIGFGVDAGRKFALWTLLEAFGEAPLPADAFATEPKLKAAAEDYLSAAFRLERFGDPDS
jgi:hypothetical protein